SANAAAAFVPLDTLRMGSLLCPTPALRPWARTSDGNDEAGRGKVNRAPAASERVADRARDLVRAGLPSEVRRPRSGLGQHARDGGHDAVVGRAFPQLVEHQ